MIQHSKNIYQGVEISADGIPTNTEDFARLLQASLDCWTQAAIKVVWLQLSEALSTHIPIAINLGFHFHHSAGGVLTLTKRLIEGAEIPHFATHTIGAGGVVINEHNQILTIVEKLNMQDKPNHFKFPGGMLEKGELISEGVIREVFEETGIKTVFKSLISFRHHHAGQFGTSNIYAICCLTPISTDITIDPEEIGKAQWMDIDEYLAMESVAEFNKKVLKAVLNNQTISSIKLDNYMKGNKDQYEIYLR